MRSSTLAAIVTLGLGPLAPLWAQTVNTVELTVRTADERRFAAPTRSRLEDWEFLGAGVQVNGASPKVKELVTRGQSCQDSRRRCFGVQLKGQVEVLGSEGAWAPKDFNLASMNEDRGYINNMIGFGLSRRMGLPTVKTAYARVLMNGKNQGLYLLVERPDDAADRLGAHALVRRRRGGDLEFKEYYGDRAQASLEDIFAPLENMYESLQNTPENLRGVHQVAGAHIGMGGHYRLLALHSLLKSGDYTDELFLMARPNKGQLTYDVMAWDFEDLFGDPRRGRENDLAREAGWFQNSLMYSFEDPLDIAIRNDPAAHAELDRQALHLLKEVLTPEALRAQIDEVRASISPYLDDQEALAMSVSDNAVFHADKLPYTKEVILKLLETRYEELLARRQELLGRLATP